MIAGAVPFLHLLLVAGRFASGAAALCPHSQYAVVINTSATTLESSWTGELSDDAHATAGAASGELDTEHAIECRECSLCGMAQLCLRAGPDAGCMDCPAGRYNADRDPISGCDDCPEDTTSEPGALECAPDACGGLCLKIIGGVAATLLGAAALGAVKLVANGGRCRRCCCGGGGKFLRLASAEDESIEVGSAGSSSSSASTKPIRPRTIEDLSRELSDGVCEQLYEMSGADFDALLNQHNVAAHVRHGLRKEWATQVEQRQHGLPSQRRSGALRDLERQVSSDGLEVEVELASRSAPGASSAALSPEEQKDFEAFVRDSDSAEIQVEHFTADSDYDDFLEKSGQLTKKERQIEREISYEYEVGDAEAEMLQLNTSRPLEPEPEPELRRQPINAPGHWDAMISYTQKSKEAELLAESLWSSLRERGKSVWLDVKNDQLHTAAMKEAATNSSCILAIITGGNDPYFSREFCLQELRWAREAGVPIQPVVAREDKNKIGELIAAAPSDLRCLGDVNFQPLDRISPAIWSTSMDELVKAMAPERLVTLQQQQQQQQQQQRRLPRRLFGAVRASAWSRERL
jgi:hypothetical protein